MEIDKITFIIACHGSIVSKLNIVEIEKNSQTIWKTYEEEIDDDGSFHENSISEGGNIPKTEKNVTYTTNDEILQFEYAELDTSRLNVNLHTRDTCAGIPKFRLSRALTNTFHPSKKEGFVNEVIHEITTVHPFDLFESGYGKVARVTHKDYLKTKRSSRAKGTRKRIKPRLKRLRPKRVKTMKRVKKGTPLTHLMTYENEKVHKMLDKLYTVNSYDEDDYKLVMVLTMGDINEEYVLVSKDIGEVLDSIKKMKLFSEAISKKMVNIISVNRDEINIRVPQTTLQNLLDLGLTIKASCVDKSIPIDVYDETCNTFMNLGDQFSSDGKSLNPRELSIVRVIDDYLRKKDLAYGGKN